MSEQRICMLGLGNERHVTLTVASKKSLSEQATLGRMKRMTMSRKLYYEEKLIIQYVQERVGLDSFLI